MNVLDSIERAISEYADLVKQKNQAELILSNTLSKLDKINAESLLLEKSTLAEQQVRPLLSASTIKQCEELANTAISTVFDMPYTVEFSSENQRFYLNKGDYKTDLADAEGGGIITVVSFVFTIFLMVKLNSRRFIAMDEAFTQISDHYFPNFLGFVRQLCKDLSVDLMLISHDQRIDLSDVDNAYFVEDGIVKRLK